MEKYGKDGRNALETNYLQKRSVLHKSELEKDVGLTCGQCCIHQQRGVLHPQARFRYQNLDLLKVLQECPFQPCNKPSAALLSKIKGGHDNDFIDVKPRLALPNPLQRKFPSLARQTPAPLA